MAPTKKASPQEGRKKAKPTETKDQAVREALGLLAALMVEWRGTMPNGVRVRAEAFVDKVAELRERP